jgi:hypothetical protein
MGLTLTGCCPGCATGTCGQDCFTVLGPASGCAPTSQPVAGAAVTVTRGGVTVGTCTTDAGGMCCVGITSGGADSWSVTPPAGSCLNGASGSFTSTCAGPNGATVNLTAAAGCLCTGCCGFPQPVTLFLTTAAGTFTLTNSGGFWFACGPAAVPKVATAAGVVCPCPGVGNASLLFQAPATAGNTNVGFELDCNGSNFAVFGSFDYGTGNTDCATVTSGGLTSCQGNSPDWAYARAKTTGSCNATGLNNEFQGGQHTITNPLTATVTSSSCSPTSVLITGTFPTSFVDPGSGLTIAVPFGGSFVITN